MWVAVDIRMVWSMERMKVGAVVRAGMMWAAPPRSQVRLR